MPVAPLPKIAYVLGAELHRDRELIALVREAGTEPRLLSASALVKEDEQRTAPAVVLLGVGRSDVGRAAQRVRELRATGVGAPILLIAAEGNDAAIAEAVDAGASDFVRRASLRGELALRLYALERRVARWPTTRRFRLGEMEVDRASHEVRCGGRAVSLTTQEYRVLECLAEHHGQPVPRQLLVERVWGRAPHIRQRSNVVDVYVAYLRKKLSSLGAAETVRTLRGIGYTISEDCRTIER